MADITVNLPPGVYKRLEEAAQKVGKSPEVLAEDWLTERLETTPDVITESQAKVRQSLQAAGLLAEVGSGLRQLADPTVPLAEVQDFLSRGQGLSEIVHEQREPHA